MNKLISFIIPFSLVCCVPSAIRPDDIDLERDRRWRNCSFYVVDHNCGLYSDPETRDECAVEAQADYLSESPARQRLWLRQHGCPSHVVNPI